MLFKQGKSCDCVNQRVANLMTDVYPPNTQSYRQTRQQQQQGRSRQSNQGGFCSDISSVRLKELTESLESENDELRQKIRAMQDKTQLMRQILSEF